MMDRFFEKYADLTALLLTFLLPVIITVWIKRKTGNHTRALAVWLLVFGPLSILSFIFFHLFENSYRAIMAALKGSFIYNFHFYSLMLLGVVLAAISGCFLRACMQKCFRQNVKNTRIFFYTLLIAIVTAPLLPITPLGAVPLVGCLLSLAGLAFLIRKHKQGAEISLHQFTYE